MIWFLIFLLNVALHSADGWLTLRILDRGGRELNPVMASAMGYFGAVGALVVFKGCFLLMLFAWADELVLAIAAVPYFFIVGYNLRQLKE